MASRKLVRDLLLSKQHPIYSNFRLLQQQTSFTRLKLISANGSLRNQQFSVFNEFSKNIKGDTKNQELQQSVKEFKEKAEKLKEVKEDLKVRTKQTTEHLYKQVDGVWTGAEATAKKVSANMKETLSAAAEEVKETFGNWKQEKTKSSDASSENRGEAKTDESKATSGGEEHPQSATSDATETLFGKFKSTVSSATPKVSMAFQKIKEAKVIDMAKRGYDIVKDEIAGNNIKKKHIQHEDTPIFTGEKSTRTEIVIVPTKQSRWSKKWETLKEKMRGNPIFKRVSGLSDPVVVKSREIAEDVLERWETSDHPVVHKIQDLNESVFGETHAAECLKEIRRRDPSFSLPDFVAEVQEIVKPVLHAYIKGDSEILKKYCCSEVIQRCQLEKLAFESQGIFFENKILHISDAEITETKMMGTHPIIIVSFQTQQIYCVRDKHGAITEGSKDSINTVFYEWAMQLIEPEELGEGAIYPLWKLREMRRQDFKALI